MSDFEFVACRDKFRTVPEGRCRFNGGTIDNGGNGKCQPAHDVVHDSELFHYLYAFLYIFIIPICKGNSFLWNTPHWALTIIVF